MTSFIIRTVNSTFATTSKVDGLVRAEDALALGVRGAVAMVSDEAVEGKHACSVQVTVEDADSQTMLRTVVSLSVAPLMTG